MNTIFINIQRLAYCLIIICIIVYFLIVAQNIIIPIIFALLFSVLFRPICGYYERKTKWPVFSIVLTILSVTIPISFVLFLFTWQFIDVLDNLSSASLNLNNCVDKVLSVASDFLGMSNQKLKEWVTNNISGVAESSVSMLQSGLSSSSTVLISSILVLIYTFFMLLYRRSIKKFFLIQFPEKSRSTAQKFLKELENIVQRYLSGLGLVILLLGVLNTLGLWLIGIPYALFWGSLAALLAIIPYVGTFLGGFLPFAFTLLTSDNWWQAVAIVILFGVIQFLEGNIITPKIIGDSVKINPLFAIFALIIGGSIWGIIGVVLALPLIAILRLVFSHITILQPVGLLLSSNLYKTDAFEQKYDEDQYRLISFLKRFAPPRLPRK